MGTCASSPNLWARPPPGTPAPGTAEAETPEEIIQRCLTQSSDEWRWPLSRTEEIARSMGYERVE